MKTVDTETHILRLLTDKLFTKAALFVVQPVVDRHDQDMLW